MASLSPWKHCPKCDKEHLDNEERESVPKLHRVRLCPGCARFSRRCRNLRNNPLNSLRATWYNMLFQRHGDNASLIPRQLIAPETIEGVWDRCEHRCVQTGETDVSLLRVASRVPLYDLETIASLDPERDLVIVKSSLVESLCYYRGE